MPTTEADAAASAAGLKRVLVAACALVVGCSESGSTVFDSDRLTGELTLTGSSTVAPVATEIARRFEAEHPDVRVNVQAGGSSRGIADAERGTADIGMSSRALYDDEATKLDGHAIARDGVGIIVHADNPVTSFTAAEVVDLFTGRIDNWRALGGEDRPVTVIHKSAGRATRAVFLDRLGLDAAAIEADSIVGSNQQGMLAVAGQRGAIGYVSIGHAEQEIAGGVDLRLAALDGIAPNHANVTGGAWPISRPLVLVTPRGELSGLERAFIDFARSPAARDLIAGFGYVPSDA